jgi:hypothetical protein
MNCEEARTRFVDYWKGALGDAAFDFHAHVTSCERCRAESEELKSVWNSLGRLPEENPGEEMRARFYDSLRDWRQREAERRHRFAWLRHPAFQAACATAILAIGAGLGFVAASRNGWEVAHLRGELDNMRQLVALSLMQQQNAPDRLRGVNWAYRVEQTDTEVLAALLNAVNHDPNVNVRLAAVDALRNFSSSPVGRRGLVQALAKQTSPLVQIAILDQIVEQRDKSAAPGVRFLLASQGLNADVKQRAEWALRQLQ